MSGVEHDVVCRSVRFTRKTVSSVCTNLVLGIGRFDRRISSTYALDFSMRAGFALSQFLSPYITVLSVGITPRGPTEFAEVEAGAVSIRGYGITGMLTYIFANEVSDRPLTSQKYTQFELKEDDASGELAPDYDSTTPPHAGESSRVRTTNVYAH